MKEPTFSIYLARNILQFAAYHGANLEELAAKTGFDLALLQVPDQRISEPLYYAVWQEVVTQTGDENFGLHVGEAFNLGAYGVVGYVLINSQTFEDALKQFVRYNELFCQSIRIQLSMSDGMLYFDYDILRQVKEHRVEGAHCSIEFMFASFLTAAKALTGKELQLSTVWIQSASPASLSEYTRIFQTDVQFEMPINRLMFSADCLSWPILSSNSNLLPLFEQHAEMMLAEINQKNRYRQQVTQALVQQLKGELPTVKAIAQSLNLSVRQLQRELQAEGTSFQKLLDATRQELALRHLKNPITPIHDIAFLLGFSEPSAFHRAFKRWTGKTPQSYRASDEE